MGAVTNFSPSVVATLGYSRNKIYGLTAVSLTVHIISPGIGVNYEAIQPPYVLCFIAMIINGFHSDKVRIRRSATELV